jgi:hypothetical protein
VRILEFGKIADQVISMPSTLDRLLPIYQKLSVRLSQTRCVDRLKKGRGACMGAVCETLMSPGDRLVPRTLPDAGKRARRVPRPCFHYRGSAGVQIRDNLDGSLKDCVLSKGVSERYWCYLC